MRNKIHSILGFLFLSLAAFAEIPERPIGFVNDFSHLFTTNEVNILENELKTFRDSTSNEICVLTVNTLDGDAPYEYAQRVGEKWGVGSKKNNGVVILIKPRNEFGGGEVFIATGYGVESVLTDALCKRIIENDMIPYLKEGRYYNAVVKAVEKIEPILKGEYNDKTSEKEELSGVIAFGVFILILVIILLFSALFDKNDDSGYGYGGGSSSSGWRSSSSIGGSSNRGSSFGGFGGFGGGSFGGGGAGAHF